MICFHDRVTDTATPLWFVAYVHNWGKMLNFKAVIVFPSKFTDPMNSIPEAQVKNHCLRMSSL